MKFRDHLQLNWKLAWPVMITQAGQIMVNIADNIMVGGLGGKYDSVSNLELGKTALGAVSLGNAVFFTIMITAFGFSFAISPLIAEADAKNKVERGAKVFSHGLMLNIILTFMLMAALIFGIPFLYVLDQPTDVVDVAIPYLKMITYSMLPLMIFQCLRQLSEGLSITWIVAIATIGANVINIILNYFLIYGVYGFPRLEVEGAGLSTFISRILMLIAMLVIMLKHKKTRLYLNAIKWRVYDKLIAIKILKLGAPTAFQMFFEVSAFSSAAIICGMAGKTDLAAHQIALNAASTTFMLCVGLAVAATIRVGNQLGQRDFVNLKRAGWSNIAMSAVFMIFCGILFVLLKDFIPTIYIDSPDVIQLAAQLMLIAALFQLADGVQVVTLGALRGMQDVNIPTLITFLAYFGLAIPLGYYLTVTEEMGALGMWIALGLSLMISAALLVYRFYWKTKKINSNV